MEMERNLLKLLLGNLTHQEILQKKRTREQEALRK